MRIAHIFYLFRENAADLFPKEIKHYDSHPSSDSLSDMEPDGQVNSAAHLLAQRPVTSPNTNREQLPEQMEALCHDLDNFRLALNEYPEFKDEAFSKAIISLKCTVEVRTYCVSPIGQSFVY